MPKGSKKICNIQNTSDSSNMNLNQNITSGEWFKKEDLFIIDHVQRHGKKKWTQMAKTMLSKFEIKRTGKQCRERWLHHLDQKISKEVMNSEEVEGLFELYQQHGSKWAIIASEMHGRTDNFVKNFFYSTIRKSIRKIMRYFGEKKSSLVERNITSSNISKIFAPPTQSPDQTEVEKYLSLNREAIRHLLRMCSHQKAADIRLTPTESKILFDFFSLLSSQWSQQKILSRSGQATDSQIQHEVEKKKEYQYEMSSFPLNRDNFWHEVEKKKEQQYEMSSFPLNRDNFWHEVEKYQEVGFPYASEERIDLSRVFSPSASERNDLIFEINRPIHEERNNLFQQSLNPFDAERSNFLEPQNLFEEDDLFLEPSWFVNDERRGLNLGQNFREEANEQNSMRQTKKYCVKFLV